MRDLDFLVSKARCRASTETFSRVPSPPLFLRFAQASLRLPSRRYVAKVQYLRASRTIFSHGQARRYQVSSLSQWEGVVGVPVPLWRLYHLLSDGERARRTLHGFFRYRRLSVPNALSGEEEIGRVSIVSLISFQSSSRRREGVAGLAGVR